MAENFDFGSIQRTGAAPRVGLDLDPLIRALLGRASDERAKAAGEIAKGHLQLAQAQEKTRQAELAHAQEVAGQSGNLAGTIFEALAQGGELPNLLRSMGVLPQPAPLQMPTRGGAVQTPPDALAALPPDLRQRLTQAISAMSPEAKQAFVQHALPALEAFPGQKPTGGTNAFDFVQTGSNVVPVDRKTGLHQDPATGKWVSGVIKRGLSDDQLAENNRRAATTLSRRFEVRKDISQLVARAPLLAQAVYTINRAATSPNPVERAALYSSAGANLVQAADQRAQLRAMMVEYFNKFDRSIGGQWKILRDKLLKGTLPPDILNALEYHVRQLSNLSQLEYERARAGEVKRHPELDAYIATGDEVFDIDSILGKLATQQPQQRGVTTAPGGLTPPPVLPSRP